MANVLQVALQFNTDILFCAYRQPADAVVTTQCGEVITARFEFATVARSCCGVRGPQAMDVPAITEGIVSGWR